MNTPPADFRDFTRNRRLDPVNVARRLPFEPGRVLETLGQFTEDLQALSRAIRRGEGDKLEALFNPHSRHPAAASIAAGQESAEPTSARTK